MDSYGELQDSRLHSGAGRGKLVLNYLHPDRPHLVHRSTFILCCSIYVVCLLTGYDDYYPFCLSAPNIAEKFQLYR